MKGIMFTEDMFKAVINGRKTQSRRIIFPDTDYTFWSQPSFEGIETDPGDVFKIDKEGEIICYKDGEPKLCNLKGTYALFEGDQFHYETSYIRATYQPGETVYLKEPYILLPDRPTIYRYGVDIPFNEGYPWKNKMFMPEKYARYFIKIAKVEVQKVQDITEEDARNEGVYFAKSPMGNCYLDYINGGCNILVSAYKSFRSLWRKINGNESWELNPWVFIYTFELNS